MTKCSSDPTLYVIDKLKMIMDQTGKRVVGEVLGPLNQGQAITLDCLVNGGEF